MVKHIRNVIDLIEKEKEQLDVLPTLLPTLDKHLDGGFLRKELVIIGAAPGVGKSIISSQLMYNIAKQGFKCAYFSLEISNEMIVSRMLGSISNIKPTRIRLGLLTKEELDIKIKAKAELLRLHELLFYYDDLYSLNEIIKEIKAQEYDFVVVDFLQILEANGTDENTRLSNSVRELQKLAKEKDCTVLALSQLSNAIAKEGSKSKYIEYRGSGAIATVADLGFFFERGDNFIDSKGNFIKLYLRKNRRGSSGVEFTLKFKIPGGLVYE